MKMVRYEPGPESVITEEDTKRIQVAADRDESEIDYTDNPPLPEDFRKRAVTGLFYRPVKTRTSSIDNDVPAWLKRDGKGYQSRANAILREAMVRERREAETATRAAAEVTGA